MNVYYYNGSNTNTLISPLTGYTIATTVTCTPPTDISDFINSAAIRWYFGDGESKIVTAAEGLSATHTYMYPGTYGVSAIAYTDTTDDLYPQTIVATATCTIVNYVDNAIQFVEIPPPTLPGYYTQYPYKVLYTTNATTPPVLDLYSEFSRSYPPQDPQNKWSFVRPEWKFLDIYGNRITQAKPTHDPVVLSGTVVGLSGYAEFYFIDDIYSIDFFIKDAPTPIVWVTMQTSAINYAADTDIKLNKIPGYSTTEVRAYAPHVSYWRLPDYLKITENGVNDFTTNKWVGAPVPFFVSAQIDSTTVGKIKPYYPEINFAKYLPYSVSARNLEYVPCAEDVDVYVTVTDTTSAIFDVPGAAINTGEYKFNQTDTTGYVSPGFTRGLVTVQDEGVKQLSARAVIDFNKLHLPIDALIYSPYLWLPNPAAASISMIYYTGAKNEAFSKALHNQFSTNKTRNANIPVIKNIPANILNTSGAYAVAASPGNEPDYEYYAWIADADGDMLYKYNAQAEIVNTIDLKAVYGLEKVTPASIALDGEKNLWVTCNEVASIYKFDLSGNFLLSIDPTTHISVGTVISPGFFSSTGSRDDVLIIEPTCVDTDTNNNVWVSYSNPLCSCVVKYDAYGSVVNTVNLLPGSTPQDILIDNDNSIWVAETNEIHNGSSTLSKYDSAGNLIIKYNNINNLSYLTFDVDRNPWFTYGYNKIGKIKNNIFTHVATVSSTDYILNAAPFGDQSYPQIQALEGIAGTHKNLIFVVHSIENKVYIYDAKDDSLIDSINIYPHLTTGMYNDINALNQHDNKWNKSIQVLGDWSGIRWSLKYKTYKFNQKIITGTSKFLNFNKTNKQEIRKHNQLFEMASQLKQLALPYVIQNNSFLFDTFLKSIYGDATQIDDIGTTFYEKIANYIQNHKDIDLCEIDSLYSLANLTNTVVDDYRFSYPPLLKQLMNIISIPHSNLWGALCMCEDIFSSDETFGTQTVCKSCGKPHINNRGKLLEQNTLNVTAGVPIVVYDRNEDAFTLHRPATYEGNDVYPVQNLTAAGLIPPLEFNYDFYEYIPSPAGYFIDGGIDWENPNTTLKQEMSSYNDWVKIEGIIDTILNFYLYRGLNLIK